MVIAANVARRGYDKRHDGTPWTRDEMAARQALKSLSEACEAIKQVRFPSNGFTRKLVNIVRDAEEIANWIFESEPDCIGATIEDEGEFLKECADVAVPMYVAHEVMGSSLIRCAVGKSDLDVIRGVTR